MHGHVNTKRDWMRQRECAAHQQGNKKSIPMNVPTRQYLRKSKRDKTEPSLQEHKVSARKQRNGCFAEDTKQRWNLIIKGLKGKKEKQVKKKIKRKKSKKVFF